MKKTIEILVGIPCSGKSTYCKKEFINSLGCIRDFSRDAIRENKSLFTQPYKYSTDNENKVTDWFDWFVKDGLEFDRCCTKVILDNTHCKEKYIDEVINKYGNDYNIQITFFEISLLKAHYRNIIRYFKTGKWIPFKIMNQMYRNFNKINRKKYTKYLPL